MARVRCIVLFAVLAALLPAADASANIIVTKDGGSYTLTGSSGADIAAIQSALGVFPNPGEFHFLDQLAGSDVSALGTQAIDACSPDTSATRIDCDAGGVTQINVVLLGGDDQFTSFFTLGPSARLDIDGDTGDDDISADRGDDRIEGGGGVDTLDGESGEDVIFGDDDGQSQIDGVDTIDGGTDDDVLHGEGGSDVLTGGSGQDTLEGDTGNDSITGGPENDNVDGGSGTGDRIRYDEFNRTGGVTVDLTDGTSGKDGGAGETSEDAIGIERVTGTASADHIVGGPEDNSFGAGAGDDVVDGGIGADILAGGEGTDTLDYSARNEPLIVTVGNGGTDDGGGSDGLLGARDEVSAFEVVLGGSAGDDLTTAEVAPVTLRGNGGDDQLTGGGLDDLLVGGSGADVISGAGGFDTASYADAGRTEGVQVTVASGAGDDGSAFDSGPGGVRDTVLGAEVVEGTPFADVLVGDTVPNRLLGGGGDDVLRGGLGPDFLSGGEGADTASYEERSAAVTVTLDGLVGDGEAAEQDEIAADVENATGGSGGDTISGNDLANVLAGGGGNDTLTGIGGIDSFQAGAGDDLVQAVDGNAEAVDCGDGTDRAEADLADVLTACETRSAVDRDGDGIPDPPDCDDNDPFRHQGAPERLGNAVDENCDGVAAPFPGTGASITWFFAWRGKRSWVTALTIAKVPAGASITVTCKPPRKQRRACPFKRVRRSYPNGSSRIKLRAIFKKRRFPPGVRLEFRLTAPERIGAVRVARTRKGKPRISILCLPPGAAKPVAC